MSNRAMAMLIRAVAIAAAALALQRLVVESYRANHVLDDVEKRTETASKLNGASRVVMARENIDLLDSVGRAVRTNVDYYILAAENAKIANDSQTALVRYDGALRVDRRPEIYFGRGMVRFDLRDTRGAVEDLTTAVEFAPQYLRLIRDHELRERVRQASHQ